MTVLQDSSLRGPECGTIRPADRDLPSPCGGGASLAQGSRVDIPYTTFDGVVRQMETRFANPVIATLYGICFSLFDDLDRQFADDFRDGIAHFVTAAGTQHNFGSRPRRFAGGPGLRPASYFTVSGETGDRGALRDEMTAYYSGSSGVTATIYDPTVDEWLTDELGRAGVVDLDQPLLYIEYRLEPTIGSRSLAALRETDNSFEIGDTVGVTYGVTRSEIQLERVVDLRDPEVQDWFVDTFVALEVDAASHARERGRIIHLSLEQPPSNFGEILPVINSLETGGGMAFSQAVGAWLRVHGADGLIFPGARSNCRNEVNNGRVVEFSGWNLVRYQGAAQPINDDLFGLMGPWHDHDHDHIRVRFDESGARRGSFSIRGTREFNLIDFDLKKRHACGVRDDLNPIDHVTGTRNARISQAVNRMLDQESEIHEIFDHEADYVAIVKFLERGWRGTPANRD